MGNGSISAEDIHQGFSQLYDRIEIYHTEHSLTSGIKEVNRLIADNCSTSIGLDNVVNSLCADKSKRHQQVIDKLENVYKLVKSFAVEYLKSSFPNSEINENTPDPFAEYKSQLPFYNLMVNCEYRLQNLR